MAASAADVTNDAAIILTLAGNTVRQETGARPKRYAIRGLSRLFAEAMRLPRSIILSTIAINLLRLAPPLVLFVILDYAIGGEAYYTLLLLITGLFCAMIAEMRLQLARNRRFGEAAGRESFELRMRAARRLLNTSYSAAMRLSPAIAAGAVQAVDELSRFYNSNARLTLLELPFIALYLIVIGFIGGAIVIIPIILAGLFTLWALRSHAAMKPNTHELMNQDRERLGLYAQSIESISTVKALAVEPHFQRRLERMLRITAPSNYEHILRKSRVASADQLFEILTFLSVITVGGAMVAKGMISIGAVAATSLIGVLAAQSFRRIFGILEQVEAALTSQERSGAVMSLPDRAMDEIDISGPAKVQLNGIGMAYDGRPEKDRGVNLTIRAGEIIGIVIRDDHQRQAMADILRCRITPDYGEFLIDGRKISAEQDATLQRVMFVNGEPAIFRGTIAENISMFGCVNPATAIELAQRLGVEEAIKTLPDGYHTRLDRDSAASVPRDLLVAIALVRAAAISPRLLILDMHRSIPSDISTRACEKMIEELRGSTTIITLRRTLIESISDGRNYRMRDWSLEPVDPIRPDPDESLNLWEAMDDG
ncbi:MAG TPA: ABC transporter transmembrane domain-containing protein [Hyphomicrobiales bacterium]|nr:ABC transporter transmembrane domain-containing protein [Hyphomicrobiales bacterium]